MRRFLLVTTLVVALAMTACGSSDEKSLRDALKEETSTEKATETEKVAEETTEEIPDIMEEETEDFGFEFETDEVTDDDDDDVVVEFRGKVEDGVYENSFFGNGCDLSTLPSVYDDEQLLQLSGIVTDAMSSDEKLKEAIEEADLIYDLYAATEDQLSSLNIIIQKDDGLGSDDPEALIKTQMSTIEDSMATIGGTNVETEIEKINFAGKECKCLYITAEIQGYKIYERQIYVSSGEYIEAITAASYINDNTEDILGEFYSLN